VKEVDRSSRSGQALRALHPASESDFDGLVDAPGVLVVEGDAEDPAETFATFPDAASADASGPALVAQTDPS